MSAGLDAATVTPGSTAPDESRATPVIDAWAKAGVAADRITTSTVPIRTTRRMRNSFQHEGHEDREGHEDAPRRQRATLRIPQETGVKALTPLKHCAANVPK